MRQLCKPHPAPLLGEREAEHFPSPLERDRKRSASRVRHVPKEGILLFVCVYSALPLAALYGKMREHQENNIERGEVEHITRIEYTFADRNIVGVNTEGFYKVIHFRIKQ